MLSFNSFRWLKFSSKKLGRKGIVVLGLALVVPAIICLGWTENDRHIGYNLNYKPSASQLDNNLVDIDFLLNPSAAMEEPEPIQLAFLPKGRFPSLSELDDIYTDSTFRSSLSSRSAFKLPMYWKLFRDELAYHEIELKSGPDEMVNIEIAARAVDGAIIQPGDTFSFNKTVGERSEDRGFRSGLMFSGGEVISGVGGGVCIVSTALYNVALESGCKIIQRVHHSGTVRYAKPGLDSAVVYGLSDLQFKNDTGNPILVRSRVEDNRLMVGLYGKKRPGLEVVITNEDYTELPYKIIETEDPTIPQGELKVKVPARVGFEVTTVRVIKVNGKTIKQEVLSHDMIAARNKVILIPPKPEDEQVKPDETAQTDKLTVDIEATKEKLEQLKNDEAAKVKPAQKSAVLTTKTDEPVKSKGPITTEKVPEVKEKASEPTTAPQLDIKLGMQGKTPGADLLHPKENK